MSDLLLLNGPNLNLLGSREPSVYGDTTLADIESRCQAVASELGLKLDCFQSNAEHLLIERIHKAREQEVDFILFNPGAFTHTSVALRDALLAVDVPFVEIHLSNTFAREAFRHESFFSDIAIGSIVGFGAFGYEMALMAARTHLASD